MHTLAILGAGDLGATLARRLARAGAARRIVLVDPEEGRARGKALDILQSGPVEGFDARVEGAARIEDGLEPDAVVIADLPELLDPDAVARKAREVMTGVVPRVGRGLLLIAIADAAPLVAAAAGKGLARERVLGSAPVASAAALRKRLADELSASPGDVALALLGLPPEHLVVPHASATCGGVPVDLLSPIALRRALERVRGRRPGPVALATAAARVLRAAARGEDTLLPLVAWLDGEYGHRGVAAAVPARVARGRLERVLEFELAPVDRVGFDDAVQRAREAAW